MRTTGDPGIDSAAARADQADREAPYLRPFHASPARTVVAGSTWPSDEAVVLPALAAARAVTEGLRVVIAPHEPSGARVSSLVALLAEAGWRPTTLGEVEHAGSLAGHDAVVVDSVGKLAHLYTVGHVAYVGGGFHAAGLHSVLEPAAAGLPVLFGPRHANARAAADLARAGGAKIASDAEAMGRLLTGWLADEAGRRAAGSRAFDYIDEHRGAAARTAELLETLVP